MKRWNPLVAALTATIAACFSRPEPPMLGGGDGGGGSDASSTDGKRSDGGGSGTDADNTNCILENFDLPGANAGSGSCGPWAGSFTASGGSGSGSAGYPSDVLMLTASIPGGTDYTLTCASADPQPFQNGFEVQITGVPTGGYARLLARIGGTSFGVDVNDTGVMTPFGGMQFHAAVTTTGLPLTVRMQPESASGLFEVFHRGSNDQDLNDDGPYASGLNTSLAQPADLQLVAGYISSGTASFDNLRSCP
jgi:hypothetical protein